MTAALPIAVIAVPMIAAAQGRQLQLASTPWSPFTNEPGQARFALDLVSAALERVGIGIETTIVEEDSLQKLLNDEADYTLMDELVVQYLMSNHEEDARTRLAFGSTPLLTRSLHLAVRRSLPDAESIIRRFNAELRGMIADRSYHRLLQLDWIRADVDGDGRTEYVPDGDRAGPNPPERSYELFATTTPTGEPDTTRRFYFGGDIYEGWSTVPEIYKAPDPGTPEPGQNTVRVFTFTW